MMQNVVDEIANLKAEKLAVVERMACGHRKIDWDNTYGECVFCQIREQANDYEELPCEVVECHDRIEALIAEKLAEAERVTERDCAIAKSFLVGGIALVLVRAIRAAQRKESEGK